MDEPLLGGAVNETVARATPPTAETAVGASGTVAGVTGLDDDDAGPTPAAFVAVTVKV